MQENLNRKPTTLKLVFDWKLIDFLLCIIIMMVWKVHKSVFNKFSRFLHSPSKFTPYYGPIFLQSKSQSEAFELCKYCLREICFCLHGNTNSPIFQKKVVSNVSASYWNCQFSVTTGLVSPTLVSTKILILVLNIRLDNHWFFPRIRLLILGNPKRYYYFCFISAFNFIFFRRNRLEFFHEKLLFLREISFYSYPCGSLPWISLISKMSKIIFRQRVFWIFQPDFPHY